MPSELTIPSFWRMTLQDCQQKRLRDNPVENIETTTSTNVEDYIFQDQETRGKYFLGLIDESLALISQIFNLASGLDSVGPRFCNLLTNR